MTPQRVVSAFFILKLLYKGIEIMAPVYLDGRVKNHNFEVEFTLPDTMTRFRQFAEIEDNYYQHVLNNIYQKLQPVYQCCNDSLRFRIIDSEKLVCYRDNEPYNGFTITPEKITPVNPQAPLDLPLLYRHIKNCLEDSSMYIQRGYFRFSEFILSENSIVILSEITFEDSDKKYHVSVIIDNTGNMQIVLPKVKNKKDFEKSIRDLIFDRLIVQV